MIFYIVNSRGQMIFYIVLLWAIVFLFSVTHTSHCIKLYVSTLDVPDYQIGGR